MCFGHRSRLVDWPKYTTIKSCPVHSMLLVAYFLHPSVKISRFAVSHSDGQLEYVVVVLISRHIIAMKGLPGESKGADGFCWLP